MPESKLHTRNILVVCADNPMTMRVIDTETGNAIKGITEVQLTAIASRPTMWTAKLTVMVDVKIDFPINLDEVVLLLQDGVKEIKT